LAKPFAISQPAISKHLKVLERAGLISRGRDAQRRPCRIEGRPLAEVDVWLEGYRKIWQANFQRLDNLLDEMATHEKPRRRAKASVQSPTKHRRHR
jgi:DNA-binding transcriptional ArsR family regulator